MTCATCKHWIRDDEIDYVQCGYGICGLAMHVIPDYDAADESNDFTPAVVSSEDKTPLGMNSMGASDASGYSACVVTGPEFACNKYERGESK